MIPLDESDAHARRARHLFLEELEHLYGVPRYVHSPDRRTAFPALLGGRAALKQALASRKFWFSWLIGAGHRDRYLRLITHLGGEAGMARKRWRAKRGLWLSAGCPQDAPPWKVLEARDEFSTEEGRAQ